MPQSPIGRIAFAAAVSVSLLASAPSAAEAAEATSASVEQLEGADAEDALAKAEAYLNEIRTFSARFEQVDSRGRRATGRVYVQKPGKLRFEYDPPVPILIVANGNFLIHYDKELESATYLNQRDTPAWFLVAPDIELGGDVKVTDVERASGLLRVSLVKTSEPDEGGATLMFSEDPFRLVRWSITDPQGVTTEVALEDVLIGGQVDRTLFEFNERTWKDETYPGNR